MSGRPRTALDAGFQLIVPVWGENYTRLFAEVSLPTLMAPGNIPALPHPERHVLTIYTTPDDRRLIEAAPVFGPLSAAIRVEFHPVRARVGAIFNSYDVQSDCFRRAIRLAHTADRAMVFLTPDLIMADGGLRGLARIASTSVRAVLGVGIRLEKDRVRDRLLAEYRSSAGDAITIGPRDLTRLALDALHPIARQHMLRSDSEEILPSNLCWRVGKEGLVAHCFHLHPFLIYPRIRNAPFSNTVDGDYVEAACPDPTDVHVITDSDEFSAWELSGPGQCVPGVKRADPMEMIDWVCKWTTPRHRAQIKVPIRIHSGLADRDAWAATEREAQAAVASLLSVAEAKEALAGSRSSGAAPPASPTVRIRFLTVLHSEDEAAQFVEIALPSLLASANIPAQLHKRDYCYKIIATPAARAVTDSASSVAELREHVGVDVETRDEMFLLREDVQALLRYEAVAAGAEGCAILFIGPDRVLADNSMAVLRQMLQDGMRAVLVPQLTLLRDSAVPALNAGFTIDGILSILPGELVELALQHLHPAAQAQFRNQGGEGTDPSTLCWRVGDEGVAIHAFNYHPLLVHARLTGGGLTTADHPLLGGLGIAADEVALIRNSKPIVQCRLAGRGEIGGGPICRDVDDIAAWAAGNARPFHRLLFQAQARLFPRRPTSALWKAVADEAAQTAQQILGALRNAEHGGLRCPPSDAVFIGRAGG